MSISVNQLTATQAMEIDNSSPANQNQLLGTSLRIAQAMAAAQPVNLSSQCNGTQVQFTVTGNVYIPNTLIVMINGAVENKVVQTTPSKGIFTLPNPPQSTDELMVKFVAS